MSGFLIFTGACCLDFLGTLTGKRHWSEDLRFDQHSDTWEGLELLVEDPKNIVVSGVLLREFGEPASEDVYGAVANSVRWSPGDPFHDGPEYAWTSLLEKDSREQGWLRKKV